MNLSLILQGMFRKQLKISNYSKNTILCRFSHLFDPNAVLQDNTDIIKVRLM